MSLLRGGQLGALDAAQALGRHVSCDDSLGGAQTQGGSCDLPCADGRPPNAMICFIAECGVVGVATQMQEGADWGVWISALRLCDNRASWRSNQVRIRLLTRCWH